MSGSIAHFEFETTGFWDTAGERAERVNETIGSMSLARWLSDGLRAHGYDVSEPWGEDHGCDFSIAANGKSYLCVCLSDDDDATAPNVPRLAGVSLDQMRSLKDRLFGRNKASRDDTLAAAVHSLLVTHADVSQLRRVS